MRVVLAEDSLLLREGLVRLLDEAGAQVVAAVGDGGVRSRVPGTAVLVLSQYVEESYAADLLVAGGGVGYLLKDRVSRLEDLSDALERGAGGGTVLDPEVVSALFAARRRRDPIAALSPRERDVLGLMAEGRTNAVIGRTLVVGPGAVEKHIGSIFTKLDLPPSTDDHRRVLAVLRWLGV